MQHPAPVLGLELLPSITFLSLPLPQPLVSSCSSLKALCHLLQKALWEASSLPSLHISLPLDIPTLSFLLLCLLPSLGLELVDSQYCFPFNQGFQILSVVPGAKAQAFARSFLSS